MSQANAIRYLAYEAHSLLERLTEIRPFAMTLPMVAAAAPSVAAQAAIDNFLGTSRHELRKMLQQFLAWLNSAAGATAPAAAAQQRFTIVRMRFLSVLTQFDVFADALTERSQHGYGEWLGGMDVAAADALALPGGFFQMPPVICHLDRGAGAAIRRARTRLPGGGFSPVALIRVPRERMVGSGIASSLVHEVGHQGAALLGLVPSLGDALEAIALRRGSQRNLWMALRQWISEIVADFWSVARVGVASTLGLMSVVSLPRAFVTRISLDDPHPPPWIRVKLSAAIGAQLYPDTQWQQLSSLWEQLYPLERASPKDAQVFRAIEQVLPDFADALANHCPASLGGLSLEQAFPTADRTPARLRALWQAQQASGDALARVPPSVAFAAVGQAKSDQRIDATTEVQLFRRLLRYWALRSTVDAREVCAQGEVRGTARVV
jgi:hypothetical protein